MREDDFTERFYKLERAGRERFEPRAPDDLSLEECEDLLHRAYEWLDCLPDRDVRIDGGELGMVGGRCVTRPDSYLLRFPTQRRRPWCVLHEVAHTLTSDGHGPNFADLTLRLWSSELCGWDRTILDQYASAYGVYVLVEQ